MQPHGSCTGESEWLDHIKGTQLKLQQQERYRNQLEGFFNWNTDRATGFGKWFLWLLMTILCKWRNYFKLRAGWGLYMFFPSQSLTINSILVQILVSNTRSITKCIYLPSLLSKWVCSSSCWHNVLLRSGLPDSALTLKMLSQVLFCRTGFIIKDLMFGFQNKNQH